MDKVNDKQEEADTVLSDTTSHAQTFVQNFNNLYCRNFLEICNSN